jgi:hypothetical protein
MIIPVVHDRGTFSLSLTIQRRIWTAPIIILPSLINRIPIVSILADNLAHSAIHL